MCNSLNYIGSIALSIIFGIIVGTLFFMGFITGIETVIWIVFGLAVLNYILFLIIDLLDSENLRTCKCKYLTGIFVGIIGTIILSIVALGIVLSVGSIISSIVAAIGGFFVAFMFINILLFLLCLNRNCPRCSCSCNYNNNSNEYRQIRGIYE